MNFLAHLFLTRNNAPLSVGNFLGDFLTNKQVDKLPVKIQEGVWLHRAIDNFTDKHSAVRAGVEMLKPLHGRYAPVVLDVMFDYLLAKNWSTYAGRQSLRDFADITYQVLLDATPVMPEKIAERTKKMIAADWLVHYASVEGIAYTFSKMQLRSSRPDRIKNAASSMVHHMEGLNEIFVRFFPELITFVNAKMENN